MMMIPHRVPESVSSSAALNAAGGNAIRKNRSGLNHFPASGARVSLSAKGVGTGDFKAVLMNARLESLR